MFNDGTVPGTWGLQDCRTVLEYKPGKRLSLSFFPWNGPVRALSRTAFIAWISLPLICTLQDMVLSRPPRHISYPSSYSLTHTSTRTKVAISTQSFLRGFLHQKIPPRTGCMKYIVGYPLVNWQTRCSWGCSTNNFVINLFIVSVILLFRRHLHTKTIRARDLKFWHNVHHPLCVWWNMSYVMCYLSWVICQVSHVMCHMSDVTCQMSLFYFHFFFYKVVKLFGWWSVINGTNLV